MRSTIAVTVPAPSRRLLSLPELRAATGVETGQDATLETIGADVSADIAAACNIRTDGVHQPTLLRETIAQTFRRDLDPLPRIQETLILARRPVASGMTIVECGTTLVEDVDYTIDAARGIVTRMNGLLPWRWTVWGAEQTIVATFQGGLPEVPDDLKAAARELARIYWFRRRRDPAIRQEEVTGVGAVTYWIGSPSDPLIPESVLQRLSRFMNMAVA